MRYRLGKTFALDVIQVPPTDPSDPVAKVDVEETILDVKENTLRLHLPTTSAETHNRLVELRVYLVPHDQQPPADVEGYLQSELPYSPVDVSAFAGAEGGPVSIELPSVDRLVPYFGQIVQGYED